MKRGPSLLSWAADRHSVRAAAAAAMGAGYSSGKGDGPLAELKFGWALRYADSVGWAAVKDQMPDLLPHHAARPGRHRCRRCRCLSRLPLGRHGLLLLAHCTGRTWSNSNS